MNEAKMQDFGKLVLRIFLAVLMIPHGISKITQGIEGVKTSVVEAGLPQFIAYGVYLGELIAPAALLIGFYTRASASIVFINMIFTIALAHSHDLIKLNDYGAFALELNYLYGGLALALALLGGGRLGLGR